jgi:hypothetical protein
MLIVGHCFIHSRRMWGSRCGASHFRRHSQRSYFVHIHRSSPLVRGQPSDNLLHLLVGVDPEALILCHARQLHVLAVQLLLHDLLERLEDENFGLRQGKRLVELVL